MATTHSRPARRAIFETLVSLLVVAAAWASGCAGRQATDDETSSDESQATSSESQTSEATDASEAGATTTDDSDDSGRSPCGLESFDVHFYDDQTRVTKTIDCEDREVVEVDRAPIGAERLERAESAGLPRETWYLLVDPEGRRPELLSNDQLVEVSREFDLQFLGRDDERNLLIYEYREKL